MDVGLPRLILKQRKFVIKHLFALVTKKTHDTMAIYAFLKELINEHIEPLPFFLNHLFQ